MSGIYKLSIQGIRSFAPDHAETIQFNRPLTLIVGTNGSGKTTIIECLRYATTGDLPPNSKNGAFVNDPNLSSERLTKAQIKLAFQNVNGVNMVLTKSLQVSRKSGTANLTFKTLENQLVVISKTGERTTISSKMADIEQKVPIHLGVSKAILDYVIFCHQDDNLWPISEPSVLKKRFDEIFDSTKFIKVLDNFKAINKEMNTDIKLLNNNVEHLRSDRTRAQNKLEELRELKEQIDEYNEDLEKISQEIKLIDIESNKLFTSNQDYEQILSRIELLKQQEYSLTQQIERLHVTTDILNDSDELLKEKLNDFSKYLDSKKEGVTSLKSQIEGVSSEIKTLRKQQYELASTQGRLKSLEEKTGDKMRLRDDMTTNIGNVLEIEISLDDVTKDEFLQVFTEKINKLEAEYNKADKLFSSKLASMDDEIAKTRDLKFKEEQRLSYTEADYKALTEKNNQFKKNVHDIFMSDDKLEKTKIEVEEAVSKLQSLKDKNEIGEISTKIISTNKEIDELEKQNEDLGKSISKFTLRADTFSRYNYLKNDKKKLKEEIEKELSSVKPKYESVVGSELNVDTCYTDVLLKQKELNDELKKVEQNLKESSQMKYEHQSQIEHNTKIVNKLESELTSYKDEVFKVLNDDPVEEYEKILQECEEAYQDQLESVKLHSATVRFNTKALQMAESKHLCILCRRPFADDKPADSELSNFMSQLSKNNEILKKQNVEDQLNELKTELDSLKSIKYSVSVLRDLSSSGSELQLKKLALQDRKAKLEEITKSLNDFDEKAAKLRNSLDVIQGLQSGINDIKRLSDELQDLETNKLPALEAELIDYGIDVNEDDAEFDLECLVEEQNDKSNKIKELRRSLDKLSHNKEVKLRELNYLENMIKDKKLVVSNLEKAFLDKVNIENTIKANEQQLIKMQETIDQITSVIEDLAEKLGGLQDERQQFDEQESSILKDKKDYLNKLMDDHKRLEELLLEIKHFEENEKEELKSCDAELQNVNRKLSELQKQVEEETSKLRTLENDILDANGTERNLRSNLDLRELENDKAFVQVEIEELESQQAESKRDEYVKQSTILHKKQSKLNADHATKSGEIVQIEKQMKMIKAELKRDYDKIDDKFVEEFAKLQTKLVMSNDINTYYKALDAAVMSYHTLKMQDINRIIDELWKRTYRGSDVDTIMIRSDPVAPTKSATNMTRSYNYRVVMVKDGTELDMRGRCSAGQRVLASIIIRLALAECLGSNFGMIALDEPTTNLDEENIESLAKALNQIINSRKKQKNFQLIVITHDELFLKYMNAVQFTDHYFKIGRNERLNSEIGKVKINSIE